MEDGAGRRTQDPNLDVVVVVTGICRLRPRIVLSFERSSWTQRMLPRVPTKGTQIAPPALGGVAKRLRSGRQIRSRKRSAPAAPVENLAGRPEIEEQLFQRPLERFIRAPARGAGAMRRSIDIRLCRALVRSAEAGAWKPPSTRTESAWQRRRGGAMGRKNASGNSAENRVSCTIPP